MMLDILDNLPRLRMSSSQFKMILWILEQSGVPNVPSFDAFRVLQKNLRNACGSNPKPCESSLGNIFYVNDIQESVSRVRIFEFASKSDCLPTGLFSGFFEPGNCKASQFLPGGNVW